MDDYIVISKRILTGTLSELPPSAWRAWIVVLFEADKLRGRLKLPVPDLAKAASITRAEAAEAIRLFQEPDEYSNSKAHDGRRLIARPDIGENWYDVVTWEAYQKEKAQYFNRLRQARYQRKKAAVRSNAPPLDEAASPLYEGESSHSLTNEPEPEPEPEQIEEESRSKETSGAISEAMPPKRIFGEDSTEMKAARYLFKRILENNSKAKEPNWAKWTSEFDKIFRIDKRSAADVKLVVDFSQRDGFWLLNVLSPAAVRKQFERLYLQARRGENGRTDGRGVSDKAGVSTEGGRTGFKRRAANEDD